MGDAREKTPAGDKVSTLGNSDVVDNAVYQLNRVDLNKLSSEQIRAYANAIDAISEFRSELIEDKPFGVTDD